MLLNHFKTSSRTLVRNKLYTLINVLGLSIGIISCLVIYMIVRTETSFDTFHTKADRIYRLVAHINRSGNIELTPASYYPTARALRNDFPEIEKVVITQYTLSGMLHVTDQITGKIDRYYIENGIGFAESEFFEIFDFDLVNGPKENVLDEKNSIALSESRAFKLFGDQDPIGKIITIDNKLDLNVVAVYKDFPENTDMPFSQALISFESIGEYSAVIKPEDLNKWNTMLSSIQTFLLLPENYDPKRLEAQLGTFRDKYLEDLSETDQFDYLLQPLKTVHTDERYELFEKEPVSLESLNSLKLIGLFLILTACINFINLSSAQAIKRAKSIGIRKVMGSGKGSLILNFLIETSIIVLFALLISIVLAQFALTFLQQYVEFSATVNLVFDLEIAVFVLVVFVFTVLFSGIYPAVIISGYRPLQVIKKTIHSKNKSGISFRRALIILQFAISQAMIVGVIVVFEQISFISSRDLGFNGEQIINFSLPENDEGKLQLLKNELSSSPLILSSSFAMTPPLSDGDLSTFYSLKEEGIEREEIVLKFADSDFLKTYGLDLVAGRSLRRTDSLKNILINETMLKKFNVVSASEVIGRNIDMFGSKITVVGVVRDFNTLTLHHEIRPLLIGILPRYYFSGGVKVSDSNLEESLAFVESAWTKVFPEYVYDYDFFDNTLSSYYEKEQRASSLFMIFSVISIFISCIGLFGLVTFMVEQKTKEVGIRKVLGATIANIMALFSKEFVMLIVIALVIASPIGWYAMDQWLTDFAYRITINPIVFAAAGILTLIISIFTVGYKSFGAAVSNPVDALKDE